MITIEQAKRATELAEKRCDIIKQANRLRVEGARLTIECDKRTGMAYSTPAAKLDISALVDEFRKLIGAEAKAQVAKIDAEMRALGVEPDEFDAAATVVENEGPPKNMTMEGRTAYQNRMMHEDNARAMLSRPRRPSLSDPDPVPAGPMLVRTK